MDGDSLDSGSPEVTSTVPFKNNYLVSEDFLEARGAGSGVPPQGPVDEGPVDSVLWRTEDEFEDVGLLIRFSPLPPLLRLSFAFKEKIAKKNDTNTKIQFTLSCSMCFCSSYTVQNLFFIHCSLYSLLSAVCVVMYNMCSMYSKHIVVQ